MKTNPLIPILSRSALAGLFLAVGGCVVHDDGYTRVERVERRPVVRAIPAVRAPVADEAPAPPAEELVVDEAYEPAPAEAVATYEPDLNPHGEWVVTAQYGRCWVPRARPVGWRPYTVGHWVNTDQGWSWAAEGPEADWGVITYHYGRWYEDSRHGWCWVPGTTWAPAWVAWRGGGGYAGWAPLSPRIGYRREITSVYVDRYIPADRFVYVEQRYLAEPRVSTHVVVNNVTIVNKTTNITNITYVNNHVVNRGVSVTEVERSSGRRYETVRTTEVTSAGEARRLRSEGKTVAYVPQNIRKADDEYRDRITRRADEQKAERDRVARRTTDAKDAEHDRGSAREKEAAAVKAAEHDRVVARQKETVAVDKAAHDRAIARDKEAALAKEAERNRVERRTTDAAAADKAEHDRALRRAKDEEAAKAAADRAKSVKTPPKEIKADPAADAKAAEHERALRRAKEEEAAKAKAASGAGK